MPIIIYPNLAVQPVSAAPARTAQTPSALARRGSGFSKTFKASLRNRSGSSFESSATGYSPRDTLADTYHLTRGASPLNTTLLPSQSRSPVYCVTTDVHPDGSCATTHLWQFDRDRRSLRDVARIQWSGNSQPVVGVVGVQMPINDFLVKSKGKGIGFSSRCVPFFSKFLDVPFTVWRGRGRNHSYTFTSDVETYKWVPHSGLFDSRPTSWRCMAAAPGTPSSKQALLALYRPPITYTYSFSGSGDHSPTSMQFLGNATQPTFTSSGYGTSATTSQAALDIHEAAEKKPVLRDIIVLTFLLVLVGRDDWRELPVGEPAQSSELVFSRMMQETYHPTWSCTTLPDSLT